MSEETKTRMSRNDYGPIHPTVKLIGTALAVFAVLYGVFALLSKSPEEKARDEARDRQVLIDAEKRGAELLQKRGDPRGWGPGVHYDVGPPPRSELSNPTPAAKPVSRSEASPSASNVDPRTIFQPGQRFGSDNLASTIDKHYPNALFVPDGTVHVTSGGKSYVITTRLVPGGSAIYEIVSVRER